MACRRNFGGRPGTAKCAPPIGRSDALRVILIPPHGPPQTRYPASDPRLRLGPEGEQMMAQTLCVRAGALSIAASLAFAALPAWAGVIDKIRTDQTLRIAYREDAPPFSYKEAGKEEPSGFIVELCRTVAKKLAVQ